MGFKKSMENVGRRILGKGSEVAFDTKVSEIEKNSSIPKEEAQKVVFLERFQGLSDELTLTGTLDFKSKEYRDFTAGMNEVFGTTDIERFKADALLSTFACPSVTVSPGEFNKMRKQFQNFFEGSAPANPIVSETAKNIKEMKVLLARFSGHPGLGSSATLQDLIASYPDAGADLGRIMYLKEEIDSNRELFGKDVTLEKDIEGLKQQTSAIFSTATLGEVGRFFGSMWKSTGEVSKGNFGGAMLHATTAFARLTTNGAIGLSKFGVATAKVAKSYVVANSAK